jgi:hypothetical protein
VIAVCMPIFIPYLFENLNKSLKKKKNFSENIVGVFLVKYFFSENGVLNDF